MLKLEVALAFLGGLLFHHYMLRIPSVLDLKEANGSLSERTSPRNVIEVQKTIRCSEHHH